MPCKLRVALSRTHLFGRLQVNSILILMQFIELIDMQVGFMLKMMRRVLPANSSSHATRATSSASLVACAM